MKRYNPKEIESRWQAKWEEEKTFKVDIQRAKKPFYNLMMFPYPSGEGLHVGHVYAFGGADTFGRFKRMKGYDVFEPMGFDSFGIHSENYAIKVRKHPKDLIAETTKYFREEQLKKLGALFDWDHEVITSEADYYKWTQWLFIQLFKAGLATRKKAPVGWCPSCKTVLADEQVIAGKCERCHSQVEQKDLEQWFFKITNYAQRLLDNLENLPAKALGPKVKISEKEAKAGIDWSETTKTMQKNWIGRSEGAEIYFPVQGPALQIKVFTTRPDTIFGATFMVLAPEHEIVAALLNSKFKIPALPCPSDRRASGRQNAKLKEVSDYVESAKKKTELDRSKEKTGVFTGLYCINPLTKKEIPIWIADYVLMGYGTGAIMAIPAHDQRDYDFAKKHDLEIIEVIRKTEVEGASEKKTQSQTQSEAYVGEGEMVNSGRFNELSSKEGAHNVSEYIEKNKLGRKTVNYHLRDWLISRQRYWGPPIPMVYCDDCASNGKSWFTTKEAIERYKIDDLRSRKIAKNHKSDILDLTSEMRGWYPVPEKDLPVELPELKDYQPKGKDVSPLSALPKFVNVKCPECGASAKRETDVSDTFLDSSWYFLRYPFVGYDDTPFGSEKFVDKSSIAKRWLPVDNYIGGNEHAVLHLLYTRFITMVLHDVGLIDFEEPFKKFRAHGLVIHDGAKMSKSRGNVVSPKEFIDAYGADTLRMYLLFLGPYDQGGDFSDRAIAGVFRFLNRVWNLVQETSAKPTSKPDKELERKLHKVTKSVGEDLENLKFNTAIASLMEFLNFMYSKKGSVDRSTLKSFVLLLAPLAPHISEELWSSLDQKFSIHQQNWPEYDPKLMDEEVATIVIQVDGRLRDKLEVPKGISKEEVTRLALDLPKIKPYTEYKRVQKSIWVEGRLLNLVTGD